MEKNNITVIMAIVNAGYSEKVMESAKNKGARGGTILNAIGSAGANAEKLYGITISPEKEIVMIIVPNTITSTILQALYEDVGPSTDAQGIAFSLPVEDATSNLTHQYLKKSKEKKEL